jgi:site-specific recombinase XerD
MQSERTPRSAGNTPQDSTRGVRLLPPRLGRPNPYGVEWAERVWRPEEGREVRTVRKQFFPTVELCAARAAQLRKARREGALRTLSRREIDDWHAFKAATDGAPWPEVVAAWRAQLTSSGVVVNATTVAAHVAEYLREFAARVERGEAAADSYRHRRHALHLFAEDFGPRRVGELRDTDLKKWLAAREPMAAATFNNYRKMLSAFFAHAINARLRADNPCARLPARLLPGDDVGILTVPQLAQLLHTCATFTDASGARRFAPALRRIALETYAGIRYSSAVRLRPEDVNMADRGIRHPSRSIKTRRRQYVEGFPEVLWTWLAVAPDDAAVTERQYLELKSELFRAARVPHPHNCLRHSFATYHLAARTNPGLTAYLLCHRNQQKLWDHYKGNATAEEGRRWETITPETADAMGREWLAELERRAPADPAQPAPPRTRRSAGGRPPAPKAP